MWNIDLLNDIDMVIDSVSIDAEEVTIEDIANLNWSLNDGDKIMISKED